MKNKDVWLAAIIVVVVLAGGAGGGFWWRQEHHQPATMNDGAASMNADSTPAQTDNAGGLSVSESSPADNLGQLGSSQQSSGITSGQSLGVNGGSGNSGSSDPVNPATFSEYDKYKSNSTALFGDIQVGTGAELSGNHQATVYYKGWLTNGQLFDESRTGSDGKLQPFTFTLGAHQVIPGWEEGLSGMKVGGTRLVIVPPALGYGATGQGSIPPNSVLVFEVQLLSVQ